jgi:hypothetical protein
MNSGDRNTSADNRKRFLPGGGGVLVMVAAALTLMWVFGSRQFDREQSRPAPTAAAPSEPIVPDENVQYLAFIAARAEAAVALAANALAGANPDTAAARVALGESRELLATMTGFYLPVTAARDLLVGAWYDQSAGRFGARDRKLAEAGNRLREVVEKGPPQTVGTAGELLTILDSLELHKAGDVALNDDLRKLCRTVQDRLTAAGFALDRSQAAPTPSAKPAATAGKEQAS